MVEQHGENRKICSLNKQIFHYLKNIFEVLAGSRMGEPAGGSARRLFLVGPFRTLPFNPFDDPCPILWANPARTVWVTDEHAALAGSQATASANWPPMRTIGGQWIEDDDWVSRLQQLDNGDSHFPSLLSVLELATRK